MFERHGGGGCEVPPARYPNDNMTDMEERRELAAQKFDEWVRFKDCFERGVGLFAKLDPRHCLVKRSSLEAPARSTKYSMQTKLIAYKSDYIQLTRACLR